MSTDQVISSVARDRKRAYLKAAISKNEGSKAIAALNRLAVNRRDTYKATDSEIIGSFQAAAYAMRPHREETRDLILACLDKTNFNSEEKDPVIRQYIMEDLEEQNFVIHILRENGVPEEKLPALNAGFARLNAIERKNGRTERWSENDEYQMLRLQVHRAAIEYRALLNRIVPSPTIN